MKTNTNDKLEISIMSRELHILVERMSVETDIWKIACTESDFTNKRER